MSSCISGGGRLYTLDLEIIKSSSNSTTTSHTSSSPSSTLSESSNSPLAISTRKPRTPRKRPNQIYNEAAALLSTAYPNIFPSSTKNQLAKPRKFSSKAHDSFSYDESNSELLFPFRVVSDGSGFLLRNQPIPEKSTGCLVESKEKSGTSANSGEVNSHGINEMEVKGGELEDDFDAESILDEEIEEGIIDSIMGNLSVEQDTFDESNGIGAWYGNPMGLGFGGYGFGFRRGVRALRHVDEGNWWNSPTVDVLQISPKTNTTTTTKVVAAATTGKAEKKKKKVVEKPIAAVMEETNKENPSPTKPRNTGLSLKLNYEDVVNAWSDRASPFSDDAQLTGNDLHARLAQIDLFSEGGWVREASVLRYKEKRRTRLFSKKIRYQVRKVNADRRPRMKGRFVRRPNCSSTSEES